MRVNRKKTVILALLGLTVAAMVAILLARETPAPGPSRSLFTFDPVKAREYWTQKIDRAGGVEAWAELKLAYATSGPGLQHTVAHVFGTILYEKTGVDGIAVCDASFAYGCYHSFFGGALAQHGLGIVPVLVEDCRTSLGCEHGIGHGLMEFLGSERFEEALAACPPETNPFRGCSAGVFMEYNVPMVTDGPLSDLAPRPLDTGAPFTPCPRMTGAFREACFHELPAWWRQIYVADPDAPKALCMKLPAGPDRGACLSGLPAF